MKHLIATVRAIQAEDRHTSPDPMLLEQFVAQSDELAFAQLVRRYSRLVYGVCLRVLSDHQDAEDAFQATFIVLARRAEGLRARRALSSWLHQVAFRIALRAKTKRSQRISHEQPVDQVMSIAADPPEHTAAGVSSADPASVVIQREEQSRLDEELVRLPEKYRAPLVLCYLDGMTHVEAARVLGCPAGSLAKRLAYGLDLLRERLAVRGVIGGSVLTAMLLRPELATAVPPSLLDSAKLAALAAVPAVGTNAAGSNAAHEMAQAFLTASAITRWKVVSVMFAVVASIGLVGIGLGGAAPAEKPQRDIPPVAQATADARDPLPAGAVARFGSLRLRAREMSEVIALSPDGKTVAAWVAGENGWHLQLWDAATGKELRALKAPQPCGITFSPDGRKITTAGWADGTIRIFAVDTAKELARLTGGPAHVAAVTWAKNGIAAIDGDDGDGRVMIWPGDPGGEVKPVLTSESFCDIGSDVKFSPDEKSLIVIGWKKKNWLPYARRLDLATGRFSDAFGSKDAFSGRMMIFSPDGKRVATSSYGEDFIRVWDPATGKLIVSWEPEGDGRSGVSWSPDGKVIIASERDGRIRVWDSTSGAELDCLRNPHLGHVTGHASTPDGRSIATAGSDGRIRIWSVGTKATFLTERVKLDGHTIPVAALAFSSDGATMTSADRARMIYSWRVKDSRLLDQAEELTEGYGPLTLSRDGSTLVQWDRNTNTYSIRDCKTGRERLRIEGTSGGSGERKVALRGGTHGNGVDISSDNQLIASGSYDGTIPVWSLATGRVKVLLGRAGTGPVTQVAFSPDGWTLVSGHSDGLRVWELATGRERSFMPARERLWLQLQFAPDNRTLISLGHDSGCTARDTITGRRLTALRLPNKAKVLTIAPDGRSLAYSDTTGVVRVASFTGQELAVFSGHQNTVTALAYTPDGKRLASGSEDTTILLWDVSKIEPPVAVLRPAAQAAITSEILNQAWKDLADANSMKVRKALAALLDADANEVVKLFGKHMEPAAATSANRVAELIQQLNSDDFTEREKATAALAAIGPQAEAALRKALADSEAKPELAARAKDLLSRISRPPTDPDVVQMFRAMECLDRIHTPTARELLKKMAGGAAGDARTEAAKRVLARWPAP